MMIWPTMKRTPQKLKRLRKELQPGLKLFKRKRRDPAPNIPFPRLCRIALLDLVVRPVLFLLLAVIFVPKVDTPETFSEVCVFDAERGHWASSCPAKDKPLFFDWCELDQSEQGIEDPTCIQGKLRANFQFWRDVVIFRASELVLDIIQNGYKILFRESPLPYLIENRSSALDQRSFVQGAISELLNPWLYKRDSGLFSVLQPITRLCRQVN